MLVTFRLTFWKNAIYQLNIPQNLIYLKKLWRIHLAIWCDDLHTVVSPIKYILNYHVSWIKVREDDTKVPFPSKHGTLKQILVLFIDSPLQYIVIVYSNLWERDLMVWAQPVRGGVLSLAEPIPGMIPVDYSDVFVLSRARIRIVITA